MYKMYKKFKWQPDVNKNDANIVSDLEKSFSSIQSLRDTSRISLSPSPFSGEDDTHYIINEQFQAIQLAKILEKTAFELRVFSNRKKRNFSPQM